jgi:hypothetical protein
MYTNFDIYVFLITVMNIYNIYYDLLLDMVFVMLSSLTLPHSCACLGSICYLSLKFKLNYILIYIYCFLSFYRSKSLSQ